MKSSHYRCDWHHRRPGDPVTLFYEVGEAGDVPRTIDVYADGRTECRAVADFSGKPHELPGSNSLVEGSFFDTFNHRQLSFTVERDGETITFYEIPYGEFRTIWCNQRGY